MSTAPSPVEDRRSTRAESFESIPEVDFLQHMIAEDLRDADEQLTSAFKLKEKNGELLPEPLLVEDKSRFVLFPIKQPDVSANGIFEF